MSDNETESIHQAAVTPPVRTAQIWLNLLRYFTNRAYKIRGVGLGRSCEWIRRKVAQAQRERTFVRIDDFMGSNKFLCDLSEHMGSQIFFRGNYSGSQLELLRKLLEPGDVFVDIGANQGEFTVLAASLVGETGKVLAFEPVSSIRRLLHRNIALNSFDNIEIFPFGLGDESKQRVPIFGQAEHFDDGTTHSGLATMYPTGQRTDFIEYIDIVTLDHVMQNRKEIICLMKIDVEGAEMFVLKGAEQTILKDRPQIIFEASEVTAAAAGYTVSDLIEWLKSRSYEVLRIDENGKLSAVLGVADRSNFSNLLARPIGI